MFWTFQMNSPICRETIRHLRPGRILDCCMQSSLLTMPSCQLREDRVCWCTMMVTDTYQQDKEGPCCAMFEKNSLIAVELVASKDLKEQGRHVTELVSPCHMPKNHAETADENGTKSVTAILLRCCWVPIRMIWVLQSLSPKQLSANHSYIFTIPAANRCTKPYCMYCICMSSTYPSASSLSEAVKSWTSARLYCIQQEQNWLTHWILQTPNSSLDTADKCSIKPLFKRTDGKFHR